MIELHLETFPQNIPQKGPKTRSKSKKEIVVVLYTDSVYNISIVSIWIKRMSPLNITEIHNNSAI